MTRQQLFAAFFFAVFLFLLSQLYALFAVFLKPLMWTVILCASVLSNIRFFFEMARWPAFGSSARNDPVHYAARHCTPIVPL